MGALFLATILNIFGFTNAFSIPGLVPKNYVSGDKLDVFVGKLSSDRTELPFDFYELSWCANTEGYNTEWKPASKNLKGVDLVKSPVHVSKYC